MLGEVLGEIAREVGRSCENLGGVGRSWENLEEVGRIEEK